MYQPTDSVGFFFALPYHCSMAQKNKEAILQNIRSDYAMVANMVEQQGLDTWKAHVCPGIYEGLEDAYQKTPGYFAAANFGLGCGQPFAFAGIQQGDIVLDLGCAAGVDTLIAAHMCGPTGSAIGIDVSPELIASAKDNARKAKVSNASFLIADIADIPLPDAAADAIISNGVFSLPPDQPAVFREMARLLRSGRHFCISDIVKNDEYDDVLMGALRLYTGCHSGITMNGAYMEMALAAGFTDVSCIHERTVNIPDSILLPFMDNAAVAEWKKSGKGLSIVTLLGTK